MSIGNLIKSRVVCISFLVLLLVSIAGFALAKGPSNGPVTGAIFTTLVDGSEVNFNIYSSKADVYLDGGPGPGAPQLAAGLPDGTYVFQVTDPSGKVLLSTDAAGCRQFIVSGGIITAVTSTPAGCAHGTGTDIDHGAVTVQLIPYLDTPNNGGVYKVWVTPVDDFLHGCSLLGVHGQQGLQIVDCGWTGGNAHGFLPRFSKTDNFKVRVASNNEFDIRFFREDGSLIDGMTATWTDTLAAGNTKHSVNNPSIGVEHFAHIEAPEVGVHQITVENQPGCTVTYFANTWATTEIFGPGTIDVAVLENDPDWTKYFYVYCKTQ